MRLIKHTGCSYAIISLGSCLPWRRPNVTKEGERGGRAENGERARRGKAAFGFWLPAPEIGNGIPAIIFVIIIIGESS